MREPIKHETVLDTGAEQLGRTYAAALLGAAAKADAVDAVLEDLNELVNEALNKTPALAAALHSPRISVDEKTRVVDKVFGDKIHPLLLRFLKVAAQRQRLMYLRAIRQAAEELSDEIAGRAVAEVRTAVPLSDDLRSLVIQRLESVLSKQVRLRETVDASVVGGMIVRVGDTVFDSSVSGQLASMARETRGVVARRLLASVDTFATGEAAGV
ncbi:MAG: ATP synthase F1 subunit delta [Pirellulaceae bacterium]